MPACHSQKSIPRSLVILMINRNIHNLTHHYLSSFWLPLSFYCRYNSEARSSIRGIESGLVQTLDQKVGVRDADWEEPVLVVLLSETYGAGCFW